MKKRRTRKQWYEYHLQREQRAAKAKVYESYRARFEKLENFIETRTRWAKAARRTESWLSKFLALIGFPTKRRTQYIYPWEADVQVAQRKLFALRLERQSALDIAENEGTETYLKAREKRQQEAKEKAARTEERKREKRIKYLERSKAIRQNSRALKLIIIEQEEVNGCIECHYCGEFILSDDCHMDHKKPVVKGGNNSLENLVLCCQKCNLNKGQKDYATYMSIIGRKNTDD